MQKKNSENCTFPNKSKLTSLLTMPFKPKSQIKNSISSKPSSISCNNGSNIVILGNNSSVIQINNFLSSNMLKETNTNQKLAHKRTSTATEVERLNFSESPQKKIGKEGKNLSITSARAPEHQIFRHKASLPALGFESNREKQVEKFGINLQALLKMKGNSKFLQKKIGNKDKIVKENKNINIEILSSLLKRAKFLLESYKTREKQWMQEKKDLKKLIFQLKDEKT